LNFRCGFVGQPAIDIADRILDRINDSSAAAHGRDGRLIDNDSLVWAEPRNQPLTYVPRASSPVTPAG